VSGCTIFFHNISIFIKEIFKHKMSVLPFFNKFVRKDSFLRRIRRKFVLHIFVFLYVTYPLSLSECNKTWSFYTFFLNFSNKFKVLRWLRVILCGRTERRTAIANLILTFWGCGIAWCSTLCHKRKVFTRHGLTCVGIDRKELQNNVAVVVNCYDVVPSSPQSCKSDVSECYFV